MSPCCGASVACAARSEPWGHVLSAGERALSGYGQFAADSALRGDVPAVQGALVVSIVLVVVFNLLVNIVLARLSPAAGRGV